jgi:hypothetical protein
VWDLTSFIGLGWGGVACDRLWDILCAFHKRMKIRTKACYDIMEGL